MYLLNIFETWWNEFNNSFYNFSPTLYNNFASFPFFIQLSILFIAIAFFTTVVTYLRLAIRRAVGYYKELRKQQYTPIIEQLISDATIMNEELHSGMQVEDIKLDKHVVAFEKELPIKRKYIRQIVIDDMMHYKKIFFGDAVLLLKQLFIDLNLQKDALAKLHAFNWERRVKGLRELARMEVTVQDVNILPLTNSRNYFLRMQARSCYIRISKNEPFKFFDILKEPLTKWDQIDLFEIISTTPNLNIPNFSRWINYSANNSLVSFCLKLAVYFNQQDAIPSIIELLKTKDHNLRAEAIITLGQLQADEVEDMLCDMYNNEPQICQVAILKMLGLTASKKHTDFLAKQLQYSSEYDIKLTAARSLIAHNEATKNLLDDLMQHTSGLTQAILKHSLNPLIKY